MTQQELDELIGLGTDESIIAALLRDQQRSEDREDATRGKSYLTDAGRMQVANPWQAVADVFIRGNERKKQDRIKGDIYRQNVRMDDKMRGAFNQARYGTKIAPVGDDDIAAQSPRITGAVEAGFDPSRLVTPAPQVGAAPAPGPGGPVGPPAPAQGLPGAPVQSGASSTAGQPPASPEEQIFDQMVNAPAATRTHPEFEGIPRPNGEAFPVKGPSNLSIVDLLRNPELFARGGGI